MAATTRTVAKSDLVPSIAEGQRMLDDSESVNMIMSCGALHDKSI